MKTSRFWETVPLADMTRPQWEALCDGCGRCCLVKLEDVDNGEIHTTSVSCRLLDTATCRCKNYAHRHQLVDDCIRLDPDNVANLSWLPATCAYRLLWEGKPLYEWHPLISGRPESVAEAGISVRGKTVSETEVDLEDLPDYLHEWEGM